MASSGQSRSSPEYAESIVPQSRACTPSSFVTEPSTPSTHSTAYAESLSTTRTTTVDPSRGAGHAMGAERRTGKAHLRTLVEAGGMDYRGYNIAIPQ